MNRLYSSGTQRAFPRAGGQQFHRPPHVGGRIPPYVWVTVGGTTVALGYCYYAFLDEVPLTKRKRWIATSPAWERELGNREYRLLLGKYQKDILPPDHRASRTVKRVGSRLQKASVTFASKHDLQTYSTSPYTYTVIRSDMANAFVLPGNHVFVMTGLFRYAQNEDELAAILGHEIAHNLARHAGEKVSGSLVVSLMAQISLLIDPSGVLFGILLPAAGLFRELPHSRTQETEADHIGIYLAADACYDPRAAVRVFSRMKEGNSGGGTPPEFLSTHPSHESRLVSLGEWMPDAMKTYQGGDVGDRCKQIRRDMGLARQAAAQRAALEERRSQSW